MDGAAAARGRTPFAERDRRRQARTRGRDAGRRKGDARRAPGAAPAGAPRLDGWSPPRRGGRRHAAVTRRIAEFERHRACRRVEPAPARVLNSTRRFRLEGFHPSPRRAPLRRPSRRRSRTTRSCRRHGARRPRRWRAIRRAGCRGRDPASGPGPDGRVRRCSGRRPRCGSTIPGDTRGSRIGAPTWRTTLLTSSSVSNSVTSPKPSRRHVCKVLRRNSRAAPGAPTPLSRSTELIRSPIPTVATAP